MYCRLFEVLETRNIHEIVGIEMRELHFKYDRVLQCCNLWHADMHQRDRCTAGTWQLKLTKSLLRAKTSSLGQKTTPRFVASQHRIVTNMIKHDQSHKLQKKGQLNTVR